MFLGVRRLTSEKIVGDGNGIYVVQSIRRVDEESRWDRDLLLSSKGVPWQCNTPTPRERAGEPAARADVAPDLPKPVTVVPERPEVPAEVPKELTALLTGAMDASSFMRQAKWP